MPFDYQKFLLQATGKEKADLRIDNAKIVDVFNGTVFEAPVCISQGRISAFSAQEAAQVVDAGGSYLLPGLIDSHVHIESSMLCPARFAEAVLPLGTTTVIADPHEIANVKGLDGIRYMLDATEGLPLDVRVMLPSCVPALPVEDAGAVLDCAALSTLMDHPRVSGLGEMMNAVGVLNSDPDVLGKIEQTLALGKRVDGHSPGLSGEGLDVYAAAGVSTDHECTTVGELQDRVRRGMYVLLREGSAAHDLLNLLPGVDKSNYQRCLFCTDDKQIADILTTGHINKHLRLAVSTGMDPFMAIRMATLNAAECYGLRGKGGIAPGWAADLILVKDLKDFQVSHVWCGGKLVAEKGRTLQALPLLDPGQLKSSINMAPLPPAPFALKLADGESTVQARVIKLEPRSLVTAHDIQSVKSGPDGFFDFALNPGLLKIAVLERHHATGLIGLGLLDGNYGLRGGAIATTVSHDSHNIVVAGDNDADMLLALEEMKKLGGGVVMTSSGKVLATLPLPIGGLMSDGAVQDVATQLDALIALARDHYHIWDKADAFMTLSFMALPVIPHLKITPRGLFDVDTFDFVKLVVE